MCHVLRGDKRSCTAVFCKNWGLHVRRLGVCGYGYGYGWEISYPRQTCIQNANSKVTVTVYFICILIPLLQDLSKQQ